MQDQLAEDGRNRGGNVLSARPISRVMAMIGNHYSPRLR